MSQSVLEPKTKSVIDVALRDEWLAAIQKLNDDVTKWVSEQHGWSIIREPDKEIQEEKLGKYTVPVLRIRSSDLEDEGEGIMLEPIARMTRGNIGRVDLYAWPTLYRVQLLHETNVAAWIVLTDSGITLRQDWNKTNFIQLAKDLLGAG